MIKIFQSIRQSVINHTYAMAFIGLVPFLIFRPQKTTWSNDVGICTVLCHRDVVQFIYHMISFVFFSGHKLPVFIIDDGSVTRFDWWLLNRFFTLRHISVAESGKKVSELLTDFPSLITFRFESNNFAFRYKIDAYLLNPFEKFIYMDSDILFWQRPDELVTWMRQSKEYLYMSFDQDYWQRRQSHEDAFRKLLSSKYQLNYSILSCFNTGLLTFPQRITDSQLKCLDKYAREFLDLGCLEDDLAEERLTAIFFSFLKNRGLNAHSYVCIHDPSYYFEIIPNLQPDMIHYIYKTKKQFRRDAVKLAIRTRLFKLTLSN